eukprot:8681901-Pyramimonas_sp.AAC.1
MGRPNPPDLPADFFCPPASETVFGAAPRNALACTCPPASRGSGSGAVCHSGPPASGASTAGRPRGL